MSLKYVPPLIAGIIFCLTIAPLMAQATVDDQETLAKDQQDLNNAYSQLGKDQKRNSSAGVVIDQDSITADTQTFQTDQEKSAADDQQEVATNRKILKSDYLQLQEDQKNKTSAIEGDEANIRSAQKNLQASEDRMISDDSLKVTLGEQSLNNLNQQMEQDKIENYEAVEEDEYNIKSATTDLQGAQLKLQIDHSNNQDH